MSAALTVAVPLTADSPIVAALCERAAAGVCLSDAAEAVGISRYVATKIAHHFDIVFKDGRGRPPGPADKQRVLDMAEAYRSGRTLAEIAADYGVTRERVRQILRKDAQVSAKDGGAALRLRRNRERVEAEALTRALAKHGCTPAQVRELRRLGRQAMSQGLHRERTPIGAFCRQRASATRNGHAWGLSLGQWWSIWQESGKWEERGRGRYVLGRRDRSQGFTVENCEIRSSSENSIQTRREHGAIHSLAPRAVA